MLQRSLFIGLAACLVAVSSQVAFAADYKRVINYEPKKLVVTDKYWAAFYSGTEKFKALPLSNKVLGKTYQVVAVMPASEIAKTTSIKIYKGEVEDTGNERFHFDESKSLQAEKNLILVRADDGTIKYYFQ